MPQHRSFRLTRESRKTPPTFGELREAFVVAVALQILAIAASALLLDGGVMFRQVIIASIAYWCFVIMFALRGARASDVDRFLIKYGVLPLTVMTDLVAILLGS